MNKFAAWQKLVSKDKTAILQQVGEDGMSRICANYYVFMGNEDRDSVDYEKAKIAYAKAYNQVMN